MTQDTHPVSTVNIDNIPDALRSRNQCVLWRWQQLPPGATGEVKWTKPPFKADGSKASTDDPRTWVSFDQAVTTFNRGNFDGIGYVLTVDRDATDDLPGTTDDGIVGVDLDHCVDPKTGTVEPWAQTIVDALNSYTEVSPSGTGLRIFIFAKLPPEYRKIGNFECYESGRYLTITGAHLAGTPLTIEQRQDEMVAVHTKMFAERNKSKPASPPQRNVAPVDLDDAALLEVAFSAKNGDKVRSLYYGDISAHPSQSEADQALCFHLAFYAAGDVARVDRMFRASDLFRAKWDEQRGAQTYGQNTIGFAVERTTEFYQPDRRRNPRPVTVSVFL